MVYGTYNELVTGAYLNQHTSLGGSHCIYIYIQMSVNYIYRIVVVMISTNKSTGRAVFFLKHIKQTHTHTHTLDKIEHIVREKKEKEKRRRFTSI